MYVIHAHSHAHACMETQKHTRIHIYLHDHLYEDQSHTYFIKILGRATQTKFYWVDFVFSCKENSGVPVLSCGFISFTLIICDPTFDFWGLQGCNFCC